MKKCQFCNAENKDAARFCVKCGTSLEKRCSVCGASLEEDEKFCPQCGARTDGKLVCTACGAENEAGNEFCSDCGAALVTPAAQKKGAPRSAPKSKKAIKQIADRVLDIARASLFMAFALVMFIMSFISVSKVGDKGAFEELDLPFGPIAVNVSSIDLIEGAFAFTDPASSDEIASDFEVFLRDSLSQHDLEVLQKEPNSLEAGKIISKVVERYNVFKLAAMKEVVQYAPSASLDLWLTAAVGFVYILLSGALLIASVVDFVNTLLRKKTKRKALGVLNALLLSSAVGYAFLLRMIFGGSVGYGLVTILTLSILFFAIEMGYRLFTGELRFERAKIPAYVSAGIGAACTLVVLFFAGAALTRVVCSYAPSADKMSSVFRGSYNASSLAAAWNALKLSVDQKDMINSAGTYIPELFQRVGGSGILSDSTLETGLSPALMGVLGKLSVENALAVVGVLIEVVCIAFIITLALSLGNRVKSLSENKDSKLVYNIITSALAVALLGLTIGYVVIVNSTMRDVAEVAYSVQVSGLLIAAVVLVVLDLIQKIVFHAVAKKRAASQFHDVEIANV